MTAQDRLWQMDVLRRLGAGELSEIFGENALSIDEQFRRLGLRHVVDREAASLRGINVRALALGAFCVSGAVAGALGPFIGPQTDAVASLGTSLALLGFVALAMGGFGSLPGGLIGGFVIGLIEAFTNRYLGTQYSNLMVFAVLLLILLFRPGGLFGTVRERMV